MDVNKTTTIITTAVAVVSLGFNVFLGINSVDTESYDKMMKCHDCIVAELEYIDGTINPDKEMYGKEIAEAVESFKNDSDNYTQFEDSLKTAIVAKRIKFSKERSILSMKETNSINKMNECNKGLDEKLDFSIFSNENELDEFDCILKTSLQKEFKNINFTDTSSSKTKVRLNTNLLKYVDELFPGDSLLNAQIVKDCNVRKEPNPESDVICTQKNGSGCKILSLNGLNSWYQIEVVNKGKKVTGWTYRELIVLPEKNFIVFSNR